MKSLVTDWGCRQVTMVVNKANLLDKVGAAQAVEGIELSVHAMALPAPLSPLQAWYRIDAHPMVVGQMRGQALPNGCELSNFRSDLAAWTVPYSLQRDQERLFRLKSLSGRVLPALEEIAEECELSANEENGDGRMQQELRGTLAAVRGIA